MKNTQEVAGMNDAVELLYYMVKFPREDYPELWAAVREILEGGGGNE